MDFYSRLKSYITPDFIENISSYTEENTTYVKLITEGTLSVVLLGLIHKIKTDEGASELLAFIKKSEQHHGNLADYSSSLLNPVTRASVEQKGSEALLLLFGDKINVNISFDFSLAFPVAIHNAIAMMNLTTPIVLTALATKLVQKGESLNALRNELESLLQVSKTTLPEGLSYSLKSILETLNKEIAPSKGREKRMTFFYKEIKLKIPKWRASYE